MPMGGYYKQFLPPIGQDIWLCTLAPKDVKSVIESCFWKDVLLCWTQVYFQKPPTVTHVATQMLWYNSFIKINRKTIFYQSAYTAGIKFLYNIWHKQERRFFTYPEIQFIYGHGAISFLQYYGIINAVPKEWVSMLKENVYILESFTFPYENFVGKTTQQTYNLIVTDKNALRHLHTKWNDKLEHEITYDVLLDSFHHLYELVPDTKMRDFQFRFLHRAIYSANTLYKWKLVDLPRCLYCENEYETLEHLFYSCPYVRTFWERFMAWFECATNIEINLTPEMVMFCNCEDNKLLNTLLIMAKQHIFVRRITEELPNVFILKEKIMETVKIERNYALKNNKCKPFIRKWSDLF